MNVRIQYGIAGRTRKRDRGQRRAGGARRAGCLRARPCPRCAPWPAPLGLSAGHRGRRLSDAARARPGRRARAGAARGSRRARPWSCGARPASRPAGCATWPRATPTPRLLPAAAARTRGASRRARRPLRRARPPARAAPPRRAPARAGRHPGRAPRGRGRRHGRHRARAAGAPAPRRSRRGGGSRLHGRARPRRRARPGAASRWPSTTSGPLPGRARARPCAPARRAVILTPRAQNPTGAAFDEAARPRAARRARRATRTCCVIEDDHAGPVAGAPALTAAPGPRATRWAVVRSVSKSLGPDLRVAVLAGDATTVARVRGPPGRSARAGSATSCRAWWPRLWSAPATRAPPARAADAYTRAPPGACSTRSRATAWPRHGRSGLNVWVPVREEAATVAALAAAAGPCAPASATGSRARPPSASRSARCARKMRRRSPRRSRPLRRAGGRTPGA